MIIYFFQIDDDKWHTRATLCCPQRHGVFFIPWRPDWWWSADAVTTSHWSFTCSLGQRSKWFGGIIPKRPQINFITHRIDGAGIYANIWGILMVNVTIYILYYSIHGSYGLDFWIIIILSQKNLFGWNIVGYYSGYELL